MPRVSADLKDFVIESTSFYLLDTAPPHLKRYASTTFRPRHVSVDVRHDGKDWKLAAVKISGPILTPRGGEHATRTGGFTYGEKYVGDDSLDNLPDWLTQIAADALKRTVETLS